MTIIVIHVHALVTESERGTRFTIEYYGCNAEKRSKVVQFISVLPTAARSERLTNDWNLGKRFAKVATDKENDILVSMDAILAPGGSTELIKATL